MRLSAAGMVLLLKRSLILKQIKVTTHVIDEDRFSRRPTLIAISINFRVLPLLQQASLLSSVQSFVKWGQGKKMNTNSRGQLSPSMCIAKHLRSVGLVKNSSMMTYS